MMRAALFAILLAGCSCSAKSQSASDTESATAAPGTKGTGVAAPSGPPLASKDFYRVDGSPTSCKVDAECTVTLSLTALAGHKVNPDYPTKFVFSSTDGFSAGKPTFAVDAKTHGTMSITLRAARAGELKLEGQFKLSVCTDDKCEIEAAAISLPITAS